MLGIVTLYFLIYIRRCAPSCQNFRFRRCYIIDARASSGHGAALIKSASRHLFLPKACKTHYYAGRLRFRCTCQRHMISRTYRQVIASGLISASYYRADYALTMRLKHAIYFKIKFDADGRWAIAISMISQYHSRLLLSFRVTFPLLYHE